MIKRPLCTEGRNEHLMLKENKPKRFYTLSAVRIYSKHKANGGNAHRNKTRQQSGGRPEKACRLFFSRLATPVLIDFLDLWKNEIF